MKVLIITGCAGAVQGWGDLETTERLCEAIRASGDEAEILYVNSLYELLTGLDSKSCDIVWSSLYHVSQNANYVGAGPDDRSWIADILDKRNIPYVGPDAQSMKDLIDKAATTRRLRDNNVPVPQQSIVHEGEKSCLNQFPLFVKPRYESESTGISEESVVHSHNELNSRIKYIHETFHQPALVEEYLPGNELTVAVIGNGSKRKILPVVNVIEKGAYKKYPLVTVDLKVRDMISFEIPKKNYDEAVMLADKAINTLECYDHIRLDMREDAEGRIKIIEVNGIPGLNPIKSRSLQIHSLYNRQYSKHENFKELVNTIVDSAIERHSLVPRPLKKQATGRNHSASVDQ